MAKNVKITPATGLVEFYNDSSVLAGSFFLDNADDVFIKPATGSCALAGLDIFTLATESPIPI